jgi:hypothetical protein
MKPVSKITYIESIHKYVKAMSDYFDACLATGLTEKESFDMLRKAMRENKID